MKPFPRFLAALLIAASVLFLCACAAKPEPETAEAPAAETPVTVWRTAEQTIYPFEAGYRIRHLAVLGETLMVAGVRDGVIALALAELDERLTPDRPRTASLDAPEASDEQSVYGLCADEAGFCLLTGEQPPEASSDAQAFGGNYRILCYDREGALTKSIRFRHLFASEQPMAGIAAAEGGFLCYGPTGYVLLDRDGNILHTQEQESLQIRSVQRCAQGCFAACFDYGDAQNGPCLLEIQPDGSFTRLDFPELTRSDCQSSDGSFLYNDGTGLYTFDLTTGASTRLLSWAQAEDAAVVCQLGARAFLCAMNGADALRVLTAREEQTPAQNVVHVLIGEGTANLPRSLAELNESGTAYIYEYTTADLENAAEREKLLTALMAGDGPDLILYHASDLDGAGLITDSDSFVDLYPYLDAQEDLDRAAFLPGLLPALETRGELHELWLSAVIHTMAARRSVVGEEAALHASDLVRLLQDNPAYLSLVWDCTAQTFLQQLARACAERFIDAEAGTCSFDDPAFAELLALCAQLSGTDTFEPEQCLTSVEQINLLRLSALEDALFHEPVVLTGYPTGDGCGHFYASSGSQCVRAAIPACSRNKDGAWACIRWLLAVDRQVEACAPHYTALPVIQEALLRASYAPIGFQGEALTDAQRTQLLSLLGHTRLALTSGHAQLAAIIEDEAAPYLAGDRSLEDTVSIIQSRASVYMAEQFG